MTLDPKVLDELERLDCLCQFERPITVGVTDGRKNGTVVDANGVDIAVIWDRAHKPSRRELIAAVLQNLPTLLAAAREGERLRAEAEIALVSLDGALSDHAKYPQLKLHDHHESRLRRSSNRLRAALAQGDRNGK